MGKLVVLDRASSNAPGLEDIVASPAQIEGLSPEALRHVLREAIHRIRGVAILATGGRQLEFDFEHGKEGDTGPQAEALLTADEVAAELKVDKTFVYEAARKKKLPAVELGRWKRFRRDDIERAKRLGLPQLR